MREIALNPQRSFQKTSEPFQRMTDTETQVEQFQTRFEQAQTRAEQTRIRIEQAKTGSEQALRASELSYRRLFEAARDGILILEADTGRISDVNPFLVELLGFSRAEMIGKTVGELSPFKDLEPNKVMLERLQREGYVRYEDLPLETRNGRRVPVEFVCNVYPAGDIHVIQCNIRDITKQKRAEAQIHRLNAELEQRVIERTAQLQAVNEELEAFSYSVSHDLRAPLIRVVDSVNMMQRESGLTSSKKNLEGLTTIHASAKRMGNLIDDLLAFSHATRAELVKTEVNLDELVRDTLGEFQAETKARNIAWKIHPLPPVQAGRALLRMVLVNLISNAVKFTRQRAAAKIEIGCATSRDDETVIYLRDNGAGFDPDFTAKLFSAFQRLHRYDQFEGTGIGLANAKRIILRHGGKIWAEGIVDQGATFYFSLPKR